MSIRRTLAVTALVCAGGAVLAQAPRSGSGGELQKIMQQYQQVAAEKTALQDQVTKLQADLEAAKTEAAAAKKDRDALKTHTGASSAEVTQLTAAKTTAEHNLDQYKERMNELVEKFRLLAQNFKESETDRAKVHEELQKRSASFDKCAVDNAQLFELTGEVLDRYDHVGLFTRASASEPFTRITRTRIENLVDDYRERAEQLRVAKPKP